MRAAVVPLVVIAAARAAINSSRLGPASGTASRPHGMRASRALGEMYSSGRGSATHSPSSCQAGAEISKTPRM